jgi:murein DD-endopeptidase MepM/ murein hydrolase activator NlpD
VRARAVPELAALAAGLVLATPGVGRADPPPPTETSATTVATATDTTATTTTPAVTTTPATSAPAPTPAPAPATTPTATTPTATTTEAVTTAPAPPVAATLAAAPAPQSGCLPVGAAGVLFPHQRPLVLAPSRQLTSAQVAYPSDGSVLTATGVSLDSSCNDSRQGAGTAQVRGISLFGGAVTASSATVSLAGGPSSVSGLVVDGRPTTLTSGAIRIGNWGYVIAPDPAAASRSALEIELSAEHNGLPAGTLVFVPYARIEIAAPAPAVTTTQAAATQKAPVTTTPSAATTTTASRAIHDEGFSRPPSKKVQPPRHKPGRQPLTVTPPLEAGPYMFPVGGNAVFGDSYGGLRTDVPGGWHHGDDIFAPLGTPVIAVADGTLNRIGWERLGGWRLWVRDRAGDEFYYAHLSGYSPLALSGGSVHRGEVIGFVGNTGDAFTTMPHLHFEIHPRSLLRLQYDGAVNPTRYLLSWPKPGKLRAPRPVHPRLPRAADWRHEATVNFRELLAARGLDHTPKAPIVAIRAIPLPLVRAPDPRAAVVAASVVTGGGGSAPTIVWVAATAAAVLGVALLGFAVWQLRRWCL